MCSIPCGVSSSSTGELCFCFCGTSTMCSELVCCEGSHLTVSPVCIQVGGRYKFYFYISFRTVGRQARESVRRREAESSAQGVRCWYACPESLGLPRSGVPRGWTWELAKFVFALHAYLYFARRLRLRMIWERSAFATSSSPRKRMPLQLQRISIQVLGRLVSAPQQEKERLRQLRWYEDSSRFSNSPINPFSVLFSGSFSRVLLQLLLCDGLGTSFLLVSISLQEGGPLPGGASGGDAALARDAVARDIAAKLVAEDARQRKTRGRGIEHSCKLSRVSA